MKNVVIGWTASMAVACGATAQVESYSGSQIVNEQGFANFDTLKYPDSLLGYTEGGLVVSVDWLAFEGVPIDGTASYYPNTGAPLLISITRADAAAFEALEFQVWNGFGHDTNVIWAQAYLGGQLQQEFDIDHPGPSGGFPVLGFKGDFDQLLIGAYFDEATRDLHDPAQLNAIAMDNMRFGTLDGEDCYADFTGDGTLDLFDFLAYVNSFNAGEKAADCDHSGALDLFDFLCYTNAFNAGC